MRKKKERHPDIFEEELKIRQKPFWEHLGLIKTDGRGGSKEYRGNTGALIQIIQDMERFVGQE
eukprot:COSAG01_NODE_56650_length_317_cov_0.541284_1_plen_62_part_10